MTSYSARILWKQIFGLVIYILLEYSIEEVYKDTVLQGVGGNDGTRYHNNLGNIHTLKHNTFFKLNEKRINLQRLKGEILLERN